MNKVIGIGNCQTNGMARCAAAAMGLDPVYLRDPESFGNMVAEARVVFATSGKVYARTCEITASAGRSDLTVVAAPRFYFAGLHPDMVIPLADPENQADLPMRRASSAIVVAAWHQGLALKDIVSLFSGEVYEALGYYDAFGLATQTLADECTRTGFDVQPLISDWIKTGAFAYTPNHPKIHVIQDITTALLRVHKLHDEPAVAQMPDDQLAYQGVWPVYPEIGEKIGIPGDYIFRPKRGPGMSGDDAAPIDIETYVKRSFAAYERTPPDLNMFPRLDDPRLQGFRRFVRQRPRQEVAGNPYKQFGPSSWWSKSVAEPLVEQVDPVGRTKFRISKQDRVATAGSCFAQHIAKRLDEAGFNYFVTEKAPRECSDPRAHDYGIFTARFGNIYTVRQLLQLAGRAYGDFRPALDLWEVPRGYVDPFRPRIGGSPFSSPQELRASREAHFAAVRDMFEQADVFVFTLGLTEGWLSEVDGAVVPLPPGVVGSKLGDSYVPVNFNVAETLEDLRSLVRLFQLRNPMVRVLLTVSPVPLIATHQDRHVLEATTYSKSVLRAAAGEIADTYAHVAYFPSYEIVTGSFNRGRYFAEDLRQVKEVGVNHVMSTFLRHYGGSTPFALDTKRASGSKSSEADRFRLETAVGMEIVCDEEFIET